ncbi:MAG: DegQ family serine endoprotease [Ignavibacteria bacterium]|nr:MAG: DegQ family serine endoprotease [Ignavibacteria bacterium]
MKRKFQIPGYGLLLVGILIGALAFSNWNSKTAPVIYANENNYSALMESQDTPIRTLKDFNNAIVNIAKAVNPTVVTVFIEKKLKVRQNVFNPFFGSPFEDFFGDFFGQRRSPQPKEKEYIQQGMGSGVIVSSDGYILTNNHVVNGADEVKVRLMDKRTFTAKIIGTDPKTDIALIKIDAENLPKIQLGDSDKLQVGETVLAIGSPLSENLEHTVTMGIVSAKGRSNVGLADYEDFIQTDAAINPGNSGGALINLDGKLVGINTAIATRSGGFQGIGFAVPVNMAKSVMKSLKEHGTVIRGWLGAYIQNVTPQIAEAMGLDVQEGALISDVMKDSPAEEAGIEAGDVVVEFNGKKIKNSTQLRNMVAATPPDTEVELKVLRDGEEKTITVTLGELKNEEISKTENEKYSDLFGFGVAPVNDKLIKKYDLPEDAKGVVVINLNRRSNAAEAGLNEGDIILGMNNKKIESLSDFKKIADNLKGGDNVFLRVRRGERRFFVAFTLEK